MHKIPTLLLLLGVLLFSGCSASTEPRETEMNEIETKMEEYSDSQTPPVAVDDSKLCGNPNNHNSENGQLTVTLDDAGKPKSWTCIFDAHTICSAGADGVWTECTFGPDMMEWPLPVRAELLADPSPLIEEPYQEESSQSSSPMLP